MCEKGKTREKLHGECDVTEHVKATAHEDNECDCGKGKEEGGEAEVVVVVEEEEEGGVP